MSKVSSETHTPNTKFIESAKLLGDAWTLIVIETLADKPLRFSEIERKACGICPVTLTDRLKKLEQEQVISRKTETVDKLSVVYELTQKGLDILPILETINQFAKKHG